LTRAVASPPSVHGRSVRCGGLGLPNAGHFALTEHGDEFLRMAFVHHEARPEQVRIRPALERLAEGFGETAHYAILDGREVVYRAKVDPPTGAVRLTSTVGGRNPAHSTAVGKLLLCYELDTLRSVKAWIGRSPLPRRTPNTLSTATALYHELTLSRGRGYAVDNQENEVGVNCIAVPVYATSSVTPSGAVSISALAYRTSSQTLVDRVAELRDTLPLASAMSVVAAASTEAFHLAEGPSRRQSRPP
jgi:DNA-binding IclR family transcriptional regulator